MNKPTLALLLTLILSSISLAQAAEELLPKHLQKIESLQRRADNLAFGELGSNNYHLAKARTWLDLALSEYYDKDNSGIISAAIGQAETLLDALEKKQTDITMDTPLQVPGSEAVRPDLLDKISTLKKHEKFFCGQRPIAEAEVYLVWTGHEKFESGWSHAESYARSAEDLIYEAQVAINNCSAAGAKSAAELRAPQRVIEKITPPTDALLAPSAVIEKITLSTDALFDFDEAMLKPSELWRLNRLADSIRMLTTLEEVVLVGHTDRLRSDDHQERNQTLSEKRAESIKQYLIGKGIAADKIHASGAGSTQPVVTCSNKPPKAKQVICLQPNRRVEITLRGVK